MAKSPLDALLAQLDEETRSRWAEYLEAVEEEIAEKGPSVAQEHLAAAFEHLLAVAWALQRCFESDEASGWMCPLGDAASTVERLRATLAHLSRKPEWSQ